MEKKESKNFVFEMSSDDEEENPSESEGNMMEQFMQQYNMKMQLGMNQGNKGQVERHLKEMNETKSKCSEYLSKSYIIEVYLANIHPRITRTIQVPGDISLNFLHDRVLCPVLGWHRNYHGYYFRKLPVPPRKNIMQPIGLVYGPLHSEAVDMMHCSIHGIDVVDDSQILLGQLLQKPGDKLEYLYDIGDNFRHKLVLKEVLDQDEKNKGKIEVLNGQNACPPEDCGGLQSYVDILKILSNKKHPKYKETYHEAVHAANYREEHYFNPYAFDLKKTSKRLREALKAPKPPNPTQTFNLSDWNVRQTFINADLPHLNENCCHVCGEKKDLKKCSRCKNAFYCSKEHQIKDWKNHKKNCVEKTSN